MPRGQNPNSKEALKRGREKTAFSRESAVRANKKSQEVKKAYASLTEALKTQCTPEVLEQLTEVVIKKAKYGNLKAYELIRDQLGEKPVDKIEQTSTNIVIDFGSIEGDE